MHYRLLELSAAPLLMLQGRHVRRVTPVLPEAAGARVGLVGRGAPALRVLIAGDSSAAGVGVALMGDAMAGQFTAALARELPWAVDWQLIARTGLSAAELLPLLESHLAGTRQAFDVAVLVVGVNDVTRRRSPRAWRNDLEALSACLKRAAPDALICWSGLPPMHLFAALPKPLRAYLGERARVLDKVMAGWVKRDRLMRHLPIPALRGDGMMASDGFHPGPQGHRVWGELLAQTVADDLHLHRR